MKILAFGIAKEILGNTQIHFPTDAEFLQTEELKQLLFKKYPELQRLPSLVLSVNLSYAQPETIVYPHDEVALIPPVSGG